MKNLSFRRQFVMLSRKIQAPEFFRVNQLARYSDPCYLYIHDDLQFSSVQDNEKEVILLGYALDPYFPERSNHDILKDLIKNSSFDEIVKGSFHLGGRFVIIYNTADQIKIFNDATGFREVYYYNNSGEFGCGSTPNILRKYLPIDWNKDEAIKEFFESPEFQRTERCWIGNKTIFENVFKLLPNHYLDILSSVQSRFWPTEDRIDLNIDEASKIISKILKGTYDAAVRRFTLHHCLTAGWDSRILLAHAREFSDKLNFYFFEGFEGKASEDANLTKMLAERFNLKTKYIHINNIEIDQEFEKTFFANNILARHKLLKCHYHSFIENLDGTVTVSGTMGNEIIRILYTLKRNTDDPEVIAKLLGYSKFSYAVEAITEWLNETRHLKSKNHTLIDLFCWEQVFGNWGALSSSEQDIVREEVRPFNNRQLLSAVLALPDKYRYRHYPLIYSNTIQMNWPELLSIKVDVPGRFYKRVLHMMGMERAVDVLYHKLKELR